MPGVGGRHWEGRAWLLQQFFFGGGAEKGLALVIRDGWEAIGPNVCPKAVQGSSHRKANLTGGPFSVGSNSLWRQFLVHLCHQACGI